MSDFMTDAAGYATTYQEEGRESDGLLRIQWRNGVPAAQTPGHFFVQADRLEALGMDAPAEPWKPFDATFASGDTKEGYRCDGARLQIIGIRQQDAVKNAENRIERYLPQRADRNNRPQGWTVVAELLCSIDGFDLPVVIKSNSIKTSMALIIEVYGKMRDLRKEAGALAGRTIPPWFFYAPVRCGRDDKGKVIYEKTKGAMVTPPRLILPTDKQGRDLYNALYVGKDAVAWGDQLYEQYKDWLSEPIARDGAQIISAGSNEPQTTEEDEIPF